VRTTPRRYQQEALDAWQAAGRRGVVVLLTGAGKTLLGALAMAACGVRALVLVPTIDLTLQWQDALARAFWDVASPAERESIGVVGGGRREWDRDLVVATYDGAARQLARVSGFGLLIADEVHHLPAETYRAIAQAAVAPYRLGLSATLERSDGRESDLAHLLGPTVYRASPEALSEEGYLAPFDVVRVWVDLEDDERAAYDAEMAAFAAYRTRLRGDREPLMLFMTRLRKRSVYDPEARAAMRAYGRARHRALNSRAKIDRVEELLLRHAAERCIVFAEHVEAVEALALRYLMPAVTSQTPREERIAITAAFREGRYTKVATGRVWNEGVDVPEASVAIVIAGTGMERETVQRLGRVLRPSAGKRAVLYELVARDTGEERTADRRQLRASGSTAAQGPR
jgi:superfamily II DNA or RNA helicase